MADSVGLGRGLGGGGDGAPGPVFVHFNIHRRRHPDGTTHGSLDHGVSMSRAPALPRWLMIASGEAITTDESRCCSSIYREQFSLGHG